MNEQRPAPAQPQPAKHLEPLALEELVPPGAVCDIDDPDCEPGVIGAPARQEREGASDQSEG